MQKSVIITGANGNLGTAVVKRFLETDYRVIAVDTANDKLSFASSNTFFEWINIDLKDEQQTEKVISDILQKYQSIQASLFLAGGFAMGSIQKTKASQIKDMIGLNFETAYNPSRLLFNHMNEKGFGRIVFVGARPAIKTQDAKNMIAYALSKSLLFKLAEILNETAKGKNVVTSVIVPSTIDTPANRASMPDADPATWVTPDQIAEALLFLCSEKGIPLRETILKLYNDA